MNDDLISRSELRARFQEILDRGDMFCDYDIIGMVNNAPAVDVKPFAIVKFDKDDLKRICDERIIEPIKNGELVIKEESKWIPVSERLPEEFQRVLVTIVNYNGNKVVRVSEYYNREGKGVFRIKENYEQWEVGEKGLLAWMPLPEAYKEAEE